MDSSVLTENWALVAAAVPVSIVIVAVAWHLFGRSARGRLRKVWKEHRKALRSLRATEQKLEKARSRVGKLSARADRVKPRLLQEAKEAVEDAEALAKILDDKSQVTANLLRQVIFEEFPPARHERMRKKYLPQDVRDNRPFRF